ncbi:hypothetical protein JI721_12110 [Alicyclobacillus cycloheptanicus]|uniref:Uncharacterized protein n=1 Tax=Alicyclobacillus cycloheptanicus TaxID=1457 RepID=A0ABT9XLS7_9BACL|nr:hypothetical protein [Alicyclobacillus cycloheptanicus]MDQ0191262.1 hypothetical protein [Alicyclobacillus cycloheptanicus]WDM00461.1 hypothetical protein JI721_12110 [Alicyclobacillus cycloheptanicus]
MNIDWYNPSVGTPIVTIASYGLTFNKAAISELKDPPYIRVGYVRDRNFIVVQPVQTDEPDSMLFSERKRNDYIRVNSKDFIKFIARYCDLQLDKSVRIPAYWDDESSVLVVDLNKADMDSEEEDEVQ